jgi:hypothetical protein
MTHLKIIDRATPFEETLAAINEAYKKGHFEKVSFFFFFSFFFSFFCLFCFVLIWFGLFFVLFCFFFFF